MPQVSREEWCEYVEAFIRDLKEKLLAAGSFDLREHDQTVTPLNPKTMRFDEEVKTGVKIIEITYKPVPIRSGARR